MAANCSIKMKMYWNKPSLYKRKLSFAPYQTTSCLLFQQLNLLRSLYIVSNAVTFYPNITQSIKRVLLCLNITSSFMKLQANIKQSIVSAQLTDSLLDL